MQNSIDWGDDNLNVVVQETNAIAVFSHPGGDIIILMREMGDEVAVHFPKRYAELVLAGIRKAMAD